jgi:signal transduction histidine kinase
MTLEASQPGFFSRMSLLWKVLLSTSVALTALFVAAFILVQRHVVDTLESTLEAELSASFDSYESLWRTRAEKLRAVSLILSTMSDVRAAFGTGDQNTIRDTAGELWAKVSDESALFVVTDPQGKVIASLGGLPVGSLKNGFPAVRIAAKKFPAQASGFVLRDGHLYQIVVTPVFVQSAQGPALLNVLVAGFEIDALVAQQFRQATGGSDFLFLTGDRVIASTLSPRASQVLASRANLPVTEGRISDGVFEYAPFRKQLVDLEGQPIGQLWILRSLEAAQQRIESLQRQMLLVGFLVVVAGLLLTYRLARQIIHPVEQLDRAASEIIRQNYDIRVRVEAQDEVGRLARTFNAMCDSIQSARAELIRQERLSTIGRLSSSIVHDLRNPLAAIYGGAEMLVDLELSNAQVKRLGANIYRASRRIQELLQDLVNVSRGKVSPPEICRVSEVVEAAVQSSSAAAEAQGVQILTAVPGDIELPLERARMERVFFNLIANALEAMPKGGQIKIFGCQKDDSVLLRVEDNGPGIPEEIRARLFEPFVTAGKKNGLGLGLALSRQTIVDHGGDMWVEAGPGARFVIRLPLEPVLSGSPARQREQHAV